MSTSNLDSLVGADYPVRTHAPAWLGLAAGLRDHAEALRQLPRITDSESVIRAGEAAEAAAWAAAEVGGGAREEAESSAWASVRDEAWDAAWETSQAAALTAAWDVFGDASWDVPGDPALSAAVAAAWDAAADAAWAVAWAAAWNVPPFTPAVFIRFPSAW